MEPATVEIQLYNHEENSYGTVAVIKLEDDVFRCMYNDLLDERLIYGTEFRTKQNSRGQHEIIEVVKESPFITRRFFLNSAYTTNDYQVMGNEIISMGGFWQVDFDSLATINLPRDSALDIDSILNLFNLNG